jgi:hypothetical protein
MTPFDEFDEFLATHEPDDSWGDDGVLTAMKLIETFGPDDWIAFQEQWGSRPEMWQGMAAYALGDPFEKSCPLLLDMIQRGERNVQVQACDILRTLLQSRAGLLVVGDEIKAVVNRICETSTGLSQQSMMSLKAKLG